MTTKTITGSGVRAGIIIAGPFGDPFATVTASRISRDMVHYDWTAIATGVRGKGKINRNGRIDVCVSE